MSPNPLYMPVLSVTRGRDLTIPVRACFVPYLSLMPQSHIDLDFVRMLLQKVILWFYRQSTIFPVTWYLTLDPNSPQKHLVIEATTKYLLVFICRPTAKQKKLIQLWNPLSVTWYHPILHLGPLSHPRWNMSTTLCPCHPLLHHHSNVFGSSESFRFVPTICQWLWHSALQYTPSNKVWFSTKVLPLWRLTLKSFVPRFIRPFSVQKVINPMEAHLTAPHTVDSPCLPPSSETFVIQSIVNWGLGSFVAAGNNHIDKDQSIFFP